jgi:hypothetical protein
MRALLFAFLFPTVVILQSTRPGGDQATVA